MAGHSVFLDFLRLVTPGVADKWLPRFPCTLEVDCIRGREGKELLKERTKERAKEREKRRTEQMTSPSTTRLFNVFAVFCASYYELH